MATSCTPERAYRWSVLPLGVFMVVGGILLTGAAMLMPADSIFVPPWSDPWMKRLVLGGMSLLLVPMGIGFCLRSKVAWRGFFAWLMVGTCYHIVAGILDPQYRPFIVLSPAFNISFGAAIYLITKPLFIFKPSMPQPGSGLSAG